MWAERGEPIVFSRREGESRPVVALIWSMRWAGDSVVGAGRSGPGGGGGEFLISPLRKKVQRDWGDPVRTSGQFGHSIFDNGGEGG